MVSGQLDSLPQRRGGRLDTDQTDLESQPALDAPHALLHKWGLGRRSTHHKPVVSPPRQRS